MSSPEAPQRSRLSSLVRWVFLGAGLLFFADTLRRAELRQAAGLIGDVGPMVALAVVPFFVAMLFQTAAFRQLIHVVADRRGATFARVLGVMLSAEAVLMSFPAGAAIAETVNPYLLKRRCGVAVPEAIAATAAKKALILLSNAIYIGLAVIIGWTPMMAASRTLLKSSFLPYAVLAAASGLAIAALIMSKALVSGGLAERSFSLLKRIPSERLARYLDERREGFAATDRSFSSMFQSSGGTLVSATLLLVGCWVVEGAETYVILRLLGVKLSFVDVLSFEVVVSFLRSLVFMVPAGLGVQDASYVAFLGAFGVPSASTVGVAFVLVKRAKEILWVAIGFLLFFLLGDEVRNNEPLSAEVALDNDKRTAGEASS